MFYSHTFLAKKSPLGTVWIAAHLERRIKKHQLDEIDIPSYANFIMFPDVPIALRLSGHLLYGLVRIYSLKVKYLIQDCNRMVDDIRTVFTSVQVDLPDDADRAPFESVTLQNTIDLDAVELGDYQIDGPDDHRKTYDQITLQDQFQFEREQYVSIFINEDSRISSSPGPVISNPGAGPMEQHILPPFEPALGGFDTPSKNGLSGGDLGPRFPMEDDILPPFEDDLDDLTTTNENAEAIRDHAPNNQANTSIPSHIEDHFSHESPEVMRDAVHNSEPELGDTNNDFPGVNEESVPSFSRIGKLSPIVEGLSISSEVSFPSPAPNNVPTVASADDLDILNTGISLGHHLPDMELQPSPPVNRHTRKKRKRKQFFDQTIVLTNACSRESQYSKNSSLSSEPCEECLMCYMDSQCSRTSSLSFELCPECQSEVGQQLEDTSAIVCKRRKLPCTALDLWRFSRSRQNEQILYEPLFSGMSSKIQEVFERRYPRISESASFEASSGRMDAPELSGHMDAPELSRQTDAPEMNPVFPDNEMESEHPRFNVHADDIMHDLMQSSPGREEFTPLANHLGSASDTGKSYEPEVLPTFENYTSAEPVGPELATPSVNLEEQHLDDSNLRELLSMQNSAGIEELRFLEASNASSAYDVTKVGTMSTTTRNVARYLKDLTLDAHTPEDRSGCFSLDRILEGKTRKLCARMFFETLVLKSYGLIDVQQGEPYGDILISRTPALSSVKF